MPSAYQEHTFSHSIAYSWAYTYTACIICTTYTHDMWFYGLGSFTDCSIPTQHLHCCLYIFASYCKSWSSRAYCLYVSVWLSSFICLMKKNNIAHLTVKQQSQAWIHLLPPNTRQTLLIRCHLGSHSCVGWLWGEAEVQKKHFFKCCEIRRSWYR